MTTIASKDPFLTKLVNAVNNVQTSDINELDIRSIITGLQTEFQFFETEYIANLAKYNADPGVMYTPGPGSTDSCRTKYLTRPIPPTISRSIFINILSYALKSGKIYPNKFIVWVSNY